MYTSTDRGAPPRILIADADDSGAGLLGVALEAQGYESICIQDSMCAAQVIENETPSLIILDPRRRRKTVADACMSVRRVTQAPLMIVSQRSTAEERTIAFELGAVDYVTKPFDLSELIARVATVLRRSNPVLPGFPRKILKFEQLEIDASAWRVSNGNLEIRLTPIEFELLWILARNADTVLTHHELLTQVWGPEYAGQREYLRVHLSRLRHKIQLSRDQLRYIQTVPCVGYRFVAGVPT